MGQYYKTINLDDKQWMYGHDFGSGIKLMEHSWVGNNFVGAIMELMLKGGLWYKKRIVWAGGYYGEEEQEVDYYGQCSQSGKIIPTIFMDEDTQKKVKLVNHTKKLYVRYDELPDNDGWIVNPLPLLIACGNNRGGGDYYECNPDYNKVGIWAGDILSIKFAVPKNQWYKKFVVRFQER